MDFELTPRQKMLLKDVDNACKDIRSYEEQCYLEEKSNDQIVDRFGKIGMLGCPVSRDLGGLGYDTLTYILAIERIGEEGSSLRTFFSAHTSIGQLVLQGWANDDQKKEYIPETTSGKKIMAFALTEPAAGSDPSSMVTSFEDAGDHYIISGKKHWIGNGTIAGTMTTYAKDKNDGKISAFIVDADSKGISRNEIKNKMGLSTVKNAEICFEQCAVPKKNLLGQKGKGLTVAYSALIDGRLSVAAGAIGVMTDCLYECIRYSKARKQHGSVLAKKQLIQQHISNIAMSIESSRWLVYRAAAARQRLHDYVEDLKREHKDWLKELDKQNKQYVDLRKTADRLAAIAKLFASNSALDSANRAVQVFGSAGYSKTTRAARHFLDSRATTIYEGTNEVLELKIAMQLLGEEYRAY
jgi:alkylation response protein AidB-like acyl-CoA dehydrogenase